MNGEQADFPIARSLEIVAEAHGDPTAAIFARLFATRPEVERLFVMDRKGLARGHMLNVVFDAILDAERGGGYGLNLIAAERVPHEGMGVTPGDYAAFCEILRDTLRDLAGVQWTHEMETGWARVLSAVSARLDGR